MAALGGWFTCSVDLAGPAEDGKIYIHLKHELGQSGVSGGDHVAIAFANWFSAFPTIQEEMLTTALTALSTGLLVSAALTSTDEYSQIERLYVGHPE